MARENIDLLRDIAIFMDMPATVTFVAERYFMRARDQNSRIGSSGEAPYYTCAAILAAAKVNSIPRRLRDYVNAAWVVGMGNPEVLPLTGEYFEMKERLIIAEQSLLRSIGFDFTVSVPHTFFVKFGALLEVDSTTLQLGWAILRDLCNCYVVVSRSSEEIAAGCLMFALAMHKIRPPPEWLNVCGVSDEAVNDIFRRIHKMLLHIGAVITPLP